MKILHVIDSQGVYGAEVMLLNLIQEQINMGFKTVIGSIGEKNISEKELVHEARKRGFSVKEFPMRPGLNIRGAWEILKYIRDEKFSIVHSHGYKGNILLGLVPYSIRRVPLVATLHGYTSTDKFTKIKIYEWLDRWSHRFIDQVVVVNKGMLSNTKLKRSRINYKVIDNGIGALDFSLNSVHGLYDKIIKFKQQSFLIGSVGRLSTEKGYRYLIEALKMTVSRGVDARLVIIGDGYERHFLEEQARKFSVETRIFFSGYCPDAWQFIPCFDVYAISSLTEGLPITLLEAMQAKVPVVATSVGGIPDVLTNGESGIVVDVSDPEGLSEAFMTLNGDKNLSNKFILNAMEKYNKHYSSQTMAAQYAAVYSEVS